MGPPRLVPIPPQDVLQKIVVQGDGEVLVEWGEKIGKALRGKVHLASIRRLYGTLKRLDLGAFDEAARRELLLLRPRLAYTVKRQSSATGLAQVLEPALRIVSSPDHLRNLIDFFEAILAYHRE
jgi:CRISPR type III-A-associated protein Csm2